MGSQSAIAHGATALSNAAVTGFLGATRIGSDCRIRSYSVIQNSTIGAGVLVRNGCILDEAIVADGALLGPYAHLRPESVIGADSKVGNFVELKKTTVGEHTSIAHLSYLGDATVGSRRGWLMRSGDEVMVRAGTKRWQGFFTRLASLTGDPCRLVRQVKEFNG